MKPGDKVWFYDVFTQTIVEGTIKSVEFDIYFVDSDYARTVLLESECFPTREALCEHYRKIFE